MTDRYTKAVLTMIATALVGILIQNAARPLHAQGGGCGDSRDRPCFVAIVDSVTLEVDIGH